MPEPDLAIRTPRAPSRDAVPDPRVARELLREASLELARLRRTRGAYRKTWRRIAEARARLAFAAALLAAALAEPALARTPLFVPQAPGSVGFRSHPTFADLDGDGDLDAFVGDSSGRTIFFENTGTSSTALFAGGSVNPFGLAKVGFEFGGVAAPEFVDIDADGDLDALVGEDIGSIVFFENTGTAAGPAFAAPSSNPFGLADVGASSSPAFVDIDADGDLDALIGESAGGGSQGKTVFFENTGTAAEPAFAAPSTNPFGLANVGFCAGLDVVDVDGDGDLDVLIGDHLGRTLFFQNTGTAGAPAFAAPSTGPFGLPDVGYSATPAFADIDGDGDLDGFVGEEAGRTLFLENTGTASSPAFSAAPSRFGLDPSGLIGLGFADIDDDGDLDAFVKGPFPVGTLFFQNTGTASAPAFDAPSTNPFGLMGVGFGAPDFVDIDGDGDLDAFIGDYAGKTIFSRNTGTASMPAFAAPSTNAFGLASVSYGGTSPSFVDIDGDGDLDAFIGHYNYAVEDLAFFRNTGTTTTPAFQFPVENPFGLTALTDFGETATPAFVDSDGDGDLDAFIAGGTYMVFFRNTGTANAPAFVPASASPFGLASVFGPYDPSFVDIDADGDFDVFIATTVGASALGVAFRENVELGPGTCTDGLDNDGDGTTDLGSDPGCADASDTNELSSVKCDNGQDDDGDGRIDWRADGTGDPHCLGLTDNSEWAPPPGGCGIGPELALLAPILAAARRRRRS